MRVRENPGILFDMRQAQLLFLVVLMGCGGATSDLPEVTDDATASDTISNNSDGSLDGRTDDTALPADSATSFIRSPSYPRSSRRAKACSRARRSMSERRGRPRCACSMPLR